MRIFDFQNYREFLNATIRAQPNRGYGQAAKIAKSLQVNPSIVTLVLKGEKDLTLEQAGDFADYLGLSELETDYFLALVCHARAGKEGLKRKYQKQLEKLRAQSKDLKARMPAKKEMSEESAAIFYSHWYYSAIRMLSSLDGFHTPDQIAKRLQLPSKKVRHALDFLVRVGLCTEKNGRYDIGPQSTHLAADAAMITRHHVNWRERAIQAADHMKDDELFFTSPVTIAAKDIGKVRAVLVAAIEDAFKIVDPSPSEEALCLNLDWFRL